MPGKSFQSTLEPHFDFIIEARQKHQTWDAIAQQLTAQGTTTTKQAVHAFIKRRLKRRYPLGAEPVPVRSGKEIPTEPSADLPRLTEPGPPASEFAADPLTKPLKGKTAKSKWTVLQPKP